MSRTWQLSGLILFVFVGLSSCTRGCAPSSRSQADPVLNVDQGFNFPPSVPPDPGPAGKRTLEGIDSDHDGIRDDVQRWIYARFPNDEKKKKALRQMALSFQLDQTESLPDEESLLKAESRSSRAMTCLDDVFGMPNNEMEYVRAKVLNTAERTKRYFEIDARYDGMALGPGYPSDGTACVQ